MESPYSRNNFLILINTKLFTCIGFKIHYIHAKHKNVYIVLKCDIVL